MYFVLTKNKTFSILFSMVVVNKLKYELEVRQ